jgi:hypothetical protein
MNLIWKRPDGYHGAVPSDFTIVRIGDHSNLWVHRHDRDTFPFRISGGWEEEAQTKRLNNFVNMLSQSDEEWVAFLNQSFDHSMKDQPKDFCQDLYRWMTELRSLVKGGHWEVEIISKTLESIHTRIEKVESIFVSQSVPL